MKIRLSTHPPGIRAFTLVEIMIVCAVIALLAAIAVPSMLRARKRAQGVSLRTDLRLIDDAAEQYSAENSLKAGTTITVLAWRSYLKPYTRLYGTNTNVFGESYGDQKVGILPTVPSSSWDMLVDVCDSTFWAPYVRSP